MNRIVDPTAPALGGVKMRHFPVEAHLTYNDIVQPADRAIFENVLMHVVAFSAETTPMPPDAPDDVRALYTEMNAGDEVGYMISAHYEKDDPRVRYYDVWVRYAPYVSMTFFNLSTRLYGLEPTYLDPYEIRQVTDWALKRQILQFRILGHDFPRFTRGEHIWYEETPRYMIPGSPISSEGRGIKRRLDGSPARGGRKVARVSAATAAGTSPAVIVSSQQ